jgi:hypothetical protein
MKPEKNVEKRRARQNRYTKTAEYRAQHSRANQKYRMTAKGMLADMRVGAKRRKA